VFGLLGGENTAAGYIIHKAETLITKLKLHFFTSQNILGFFRLSIHDLHNEAAFTECGMASSVLHASS
jgi:hypothetical protein